MIDAPTGTVTLLFTDIEGSTRLLLRVGDAYADLLAEHRRLLRAAFEVHGGFEVDTEGDAFFVAFAAAKDAVAAAAQGQRALAAHSWRDGNEIRVRMGIHTGEPRLIERSYVGLDVHRAARVMAAGHGGQVLISESARRELDDATALHDLGEHRLKDLLQPEHLYQLLIEGLRREFPALKTLGNRPTNLPVQPNALIGRERELAEITALFSESGMRLLTLSGTGGTGKTRLALQVGAELLDDFASGVFFVSLAPIRDPQLVVPTIAQTLGLREVPGQKLSDTLAGYLEQKELLLLLDNFEQVVEAAALVGELLLRCPKLRALVTSRERLRIAAELVYEVGPLELPDHTAAPEVLAENEAVALFAARAQAAKPDFELAAGNAAAVADICARLEGLPLAIELAAARASVLTPQALLERLGERLELLTRGPRDADERQQTLRGTIEWSYQLLSPPEQTLFARLSVFDGGCRYEAAETVCDPDGELGIELVNGLQSLIDKSLLRQRPDPDGEPRYWMLETIREFARASAIQQGEANALSARHRDHFISISERAEPGLRSAGQKTWISLLRVDLPNLRAALESLVRDDKRGEALQLIGNLGWFWDLQGVFDELRRQIRAALVGAERSFACARVLFFGGFYAYRQGDPDEAGHLNARSLEVAREVGDVKSEILSLATKGWLALLHDDVERGVKRSAEAVDLARASRNDWELSFALNCLAASQQERGDYEHARRLYAECAAILRREGDSRPLAALLGNLGQVALALDDVAAAEQLYEEALAHAEAFEDLPFKALNLNGLAWTHLLSGRVADAERTFRECIGLAANMADRLLVSDCLRGLAATQSDRAQPDYAAQLLAAADSLVENAGASLGRLQTRLRTQVVASIESQQRGSDPRRRQQHRPISLGDAVALASAQLMPWNQMRRSRKPGPARP